MKNGRGGSGPTQTTNGHKDHNLHDEFVFWMILVDVAFCFVSEAMDGLRTDLVSTNRCLWSHNKWFLL